MCQHISVGQNSGHFSSGTTTWNRKDYLLWFQESYDEGTRADLSSEDDFLYSRVSKIF